MFLGIFIYKLDGCNSDRESYPRFSLFETNKFIEQILRFWNWFRSFLVLSHDVLDSRIEVGIEVQKEFLITEAGGEDGRKYTDSDFLFVNFTNIKNMHDIIKICNKIIYILIKNTLYLCIYKSIRYG